MKIANRYRPYSRLPGTKCLVPSTLFVVKAYPTSCFISNSSGGDLQLCFQIEGMVKNFNVMQDLEAHRLLISGITNKGFFSYLLYEMNGELIFKLDRAPSEGIKIVFREQQQSKSINMHAKETLCLFKGKKVQHQLSVEKLSFGIHKSQEWSLIQKRKNPKEYLPLWFALGQSLLPHHCLFDSTSSSDCFFDKLEELFLGSFEGMMIPRQHPNPYLGLDATWPVEDFNRVDSSLLVKIFHEIRKMIVFERADSVQILTKLPAYLDTGRALNFKIDHGLLDLEWSNKRLKKIKLTVFKAKTFPFSFEKSLKSFRLKSDQGKNSTRCSCEDPLHLEPGFYTLDQFQK